MYGRPTPISETWWICVLVQKDLSCWSHTRVPQKYWSPKKGTMRVGTPARNPAAVVPSLHQNRKAYCIHLSLHKTHPHTHIDTHTPTHPPIHPHTHTSTHTHTHPHTHPLIATQTRTECEGYQLRHDEWRLAFEEIASHVGHDPNYPLLPQWCRCLWHPHTHFTLLHKR